MSQTVDEMRAEIERLRARLALADGLAEAVDHALGWQGTQHEHDVWGVLDASLSAYRNPNPQPPTAGVSDGLE